MHDLSLPETAIEEFRIAFPRIQSPALLYMRENHGMNHLAGFISVTAYAGGVVAQNAIETRKRSERIELTYHRRDHGRVLDGKTRDHGRAQYLSSFLRPIRTRYFAPLQLVMPFGALLA